MSHLNCFIPAVMCCLLPPCFMTSPQSVFNKQMYAQFPMSLLAISCLFRVHCTKQCCARPWYVPSPLSCCFVSPRSPVFVSYTQVCQSLDISIQGETIISSLCHGACPELQQTFYPVSIHNDLFGYQCFFSWNLLNEWTLPRAMPEEMSCNAVCGCVCISTVML